MSTQKKSHSRLVPWKAYGIEALILPKIYIIEPWLLVHVTKVVGLLPYLWLDICTLRMAIIQMLFTHSIARKV